MGEVYRARDSRLRREVAIKILPEYFSSNPDRLRRFEQEAHATAALNHPNILAIYDFGSVNSTTYLVTELLQGETLREALRHGSLPIRKAVDLGAQIARGLAAAHDKGIVHRDLKPENLFVMRDGRAKILDFGLAKFTPDAAAAGQMSTVTAKSAPHSVMGTVGYMAPEQVRGREADPRSDIFALGAVLYEMLTGHRGFAKESSAETLAAILREDPRPITQLVPDVPPSLQRVVQRCLEKNPEQRFQSASDLAFALESLSDSAITSGTGTLNPEREGRRLPFVIAAALVLCAAIAITYFATRPPAIPTLSNYIRLTTDGEPKTIFGTDGSRLYLSLGLPLSSRGAAQMSVVGGDLQKLSLIPKDMVPLGISPDGSQLLAARMAAFGAGSPLFSIPLLGGSPRQIGDMLAENTAYSHDGTRLAYTLGGDLFVAGTDGTNPRKIVSAAGPNDYVSAVAWSPRDDRLRFGRSNFTASSSTAMWEVRSDGSGLHLLLARWKLLPLENGELTWTGDGKYFLYASLGQIWMLPQRRSLFSREIKPVQLTSSPLVLSSPTPSRDGKKLYVVGYDQRGELMRYDQKSQQFSPFLGGISAEFSAFSSDGQWVAYVLFPEGTLWRSKVDGTERLQLTSSPSLGVVPRWSPDGKKILVTLYTYQDTEHIFLISPDGGTPQPLLPEDSSGQREGTWSPDGKRIIFSTAPDKSEAGLRLLDLDTHRVETLPGSQGLFSPRWSPDGRCVAALMLGKTNLMLFDFQKQAWRAIPGTDNIGWLNWSKDGNYIYYMAYAATDSIARVRISDGTIETVHDLKGFSATGIWGDSLTLAPDDSPLLLRNTGTHDVYSLDVKEP